MATVIRLEALEKRFGATKALAGIDAEIAGGKLIGLVGPDGAGKTTLMRVLAGLLTPDGGRAEVLGHDAATEPASIQDAIGYMPQRFGLYEDLTVKENLDLYADLRGLIREERQERLSELLRFTGLQRFQTRLAGALSGGMKQKLGLACALISTPKLLLLDEPSVGVDPLSRRELFALVRAILDQGVAVLWSTAYLDEAERCDHVFLLHEGRVLAEGTPADFRERLGGRTFALAAAGRDKRRLAASLQDRPGIRDVQIQGALLRIVTDRPIDQGADETLPEGVHPVTPRFEDAFVLALPRGPSSKIEVRQAKAREDASETAIEVKDLMKAFGAFHAVDGISFSVRRGEVFGLLGPNGAGKSTTFKMLCGLLAPTAGTARVAGYDLFNAPGKARARLGYMSQKFSLYGDLSVRQNLEFFGGAYNVPRQRRAARIAAIASELGLTSQYDARSGDLPLGFKQRLALGAAILHEPEILFLDEPTSGVDPITRRDFWKRIDAMAQSGVTIMVTSHFMEEAEYCDRLMLVYRGQAIAQGTPDELKASAATEKTPDPTLEDAFISHVEAWDAQHPL